MKRTLLLAIIVTFSEVIIGQQSLSAISVSAGANIFPASTSQLHTGIEDLHFTPSVGWDLKLYWHFHTDSNRTWSAYYSFGFNSYRQSVQLRTEDYPILRSDWNSHFYFSHRYHAFGIKLAANLNAHSKFHIAVGNRIYGSESNSGQINSYKATTLERFAVFRSNSGSPSRLFCPELNAGYSFTPSFFSSRWTASLSLSWAPVSAIETNYSFFPDDPAYTSTGTFVVNQSCLVLELEYRFKKKSD